MNISWSASAGLNALAFEASSWQHYSYGPLVNCWSAKQYILNLRSILIYSYDNDVTVYIYYHTHTYKTTIADLNESISWYDNELTFHIDLICLQKIPSLRHVQNG